MKFSHEVTVNGTRVTLTAEVVGVTHRHGFTDDATRRMSSVLARETQRLAEIAAVDISDQEAAEQEARRLAKAPADRPLVILAAGTKDPEGVQVVRGSFDIGGKKMTAPRQGKA